MIRKLRTQLGLMRLGCLILISSGARAQQASPVLASLPYAGATITDFKGVVKLQTQAQGSIYPVRGLTLTPSTIISTEEGRMLLHLQDGSEVVVRPHTRLILTQPAVGDWRYLQLIIGRIRTEVQKRIGGAPSFQIGTPSAVISVRGTRFLVEVNPHSVTEVDVDEGVVEIESVHGLGTPVFIGPGFSSRVGQDSAPEPARPTRELRPELERPDRDGGKGRDDDLEARGQAGAKETADREQPLDLDEPRDRQASSEPSAPSSEPEPAPPE